jgi:hypothetical protein
MVQRLMSKRGSRIAKEMRGCEATFPPAEQCPVQGCGEWSNLPHPHTKTDEPPLRDVRRR